MTEEDLPIEEDEKKGFPSIYEVNMGLEPESPACSETCEEVLAAKMKAALPEHARLGDEMALLRAEVMAAAIALWECYDKGEESEDALSELFSHIEELQGRQDDAYR